MSTQTEKLNHKLDEIADQARRENQLLRQRKDARDDAGKTCERSRDGSAMPSQAPGQMDLRAGTGR